MQIGEEKGLYDLWVSLLSLDDSANHFYPQFPHNPHTKVRLLKY